MQLSELNKHVWNLQDRQSGREDHKQNGTPWAWAETVVNKQNFSLSLVKPYPCFLGLLTDSVKRTQVIQQNFPYSKSTLITSPISFHSNTRLVFK